MLESNPVVRNISEIHLRLHKLRCIPILTLHIQHGSHSPPPAASLQPGPARPSLHCGVANLVSRDQRPTRAAQIGPCFGVHLSLWRRAYGAQVKMVLGL